MNDRNIDAFVGHPDPEIDSENMLTGSTPGQNSQLVYDPSIQDRLIHDNQHLPQYLDRSHNMGQLNPPIEPLDGNDDHDYSRDLNFGLYHTQGNDELEDEDREQLEDDVNADADSDGDYEPDINEDIEEDIEDEKYSHDDVKLFAQTTPHAPIVKHELENNSIGSPGIDANLERSFDQEFRPSILSEDHFLRVLDERKRNQKAKIVSFDFPEDNETRLKYIGRLVAAMKYTGVECIDKLTKQGGPAQAVRTIQAGNHYSNVDYEVIAWTIFLKSRDSQAGIQIIADHHKAKHEDYETYEERFQEMERSLRESKAICKMALDPEYVCRFVEAPAMAKQSKLNNKRINTKRDQQNGIGRAFMANDEAAARELLAKHTCKNAEDAEDEQNAENDRLSSSAAPAAPAAPSRQSKRSSSAAAPVKSSVGSKRKRASWTKRSKASNADFEVEDNDEGSSLGGSVYRETPIKAAKRAKTTRNTKLKVEVATPTHSPSTRRDSKKTAGVSGTSSAWHGPAAIVTPSPQQTNDSMTPHGMLLGPSLSFPGNSTHPLSSPAHGSPSFTGGHMVSPSTHSSISSGGQFNSITQHISYERNTNLERLHQTYRVALCSLLQIPRDFADRYSLEQLRIYARAYNADSEAIKWYPKDLPDYRGMPDFVGIGHRLFDTSRNPTVMVPHFSMVLEVFHEIALTRGDVHADGSCIDGVGNLIFVIEKTEMFLNQALGATNNPFGLHVSYPASLNSIDPDLRH